MSRGYILTRIARHDWKCANCDQVIKAGTRYRDSGTCRDDHWIHVRTHLHCPDEEYPIPVVLKDGTKEWLLGSVYNMHGEKVFLTRDWECNDPKYHFRDRVYNEEGEELDK